MSTVHYLLSTTPQWGHAKPLCIFATRIVQESESVIVTLMISPNHLDKAFVEVASQFTGSSLDKAIERIRILSTFQDGEGSQQELFGRSTQAYEAYYRKLFEVKPVTCAVKGTVLESVPAPTAVVLDLFCLPEFRIVQGISGSSVPVLVWVSGGISTFIRFFGDESIGGLGEFESRVNAEAARTGIPATDLGVKLLFEGEGNLLKIPGLPPMYDHEFCPQKPAITRPVFLVISSSAKLIKECQGIISATPYALEETSMKAVTSFLGEKKKEFYVVGPLLGPDPGSHVPVSASDIDKFLTDKLRRFGEKSVLYISFGTAFWPMTPEYVEEIIDVLLEKQFPFIFSYASPAAAISDELANKVNSSGIGLLSKWTPQPYILSHPATGWFLSHAGNGSVVESLSNAIPLICWPFNADQAAAAAHLSENLKVAFELIEVRTGQSGLKPLHRTGRAPQGTREAVGEEMRQVIDACRNQKGDELRKNAEAVKIQLLDAWKDEGIATKELRSFLKKYPSHN